MSAKNKDTKNHKPEATKANPPLDSSETNELDETAETEDGEDEEDDELTDEQLEALEEEWVEEALEQLGEMEEHVLVKAFHRFLTEYDLDPGLAHEYARVASTITERLADMVLLECPVGDDEEGDGEDEEDDGEDEEDE